MKNKRAVVLWTGGKDCNLALHEARKSGYKIIALVTFAMGDARFRAHPIHVMKQQARAIGIEHILMPVKEPYEESYERAIAEIKEKYNIQTIITGDIAEVHGNTNWITERSKPSGINVFLPLWHLGREKILQNIFTLNFKVIFSCVKEPWFTSGWLGRGLNSEVLTELHSIHRQKGLDICGEQGEYHTLVLDSPEYYAELSLDSFIEKKEEDIMYLEIENTSLRKKGGRKKTCPRCQTLFPCLTENCWCSKLPQIMPLSTDEDCLCPDCLKIEIQNKIEVAI